MDLGRLQSVEPRDIWPHEAHDFTPWFDHLNPPLTARTGDAGYSSPRTAVEKSTPALGSASYPLLRVVPISIRRKNKK